MSKQFDEIKKEEAMEIQREQARKQQWESSAAAPQVVAGERAAFEATAVELHLFGCSLARDGDVYLHNGLQACWLFWKRRAAAPVQAQEPLAYTAGSHDIFELIREWAHKPEGERYEAARKIIGYVNSTYTAGVNDGKFLGATSSLVQPVAVPDGWKHWCETCEGVGTIDETLGGEHFSNPKAECPDCDGNGYWVKSFAAPAAQGDDIDATPGFSPTEKQFKEWCECYGMQENVSRDAFDDAASLYLLDRASIAAKAAS